MEPRPNGSVGQGQGTSFAVALTAGVAVPDGERIDFYFDTRSEKSAITKAGNPSYRADLMRSAKFCGATPRFEDDKDFLPLQAADFWAWWIRKWQEDGTPENSATCDFGVCRAAQNTYRKMEISAREDQIVDIIRQDLHKTLMPNDIIYDVRFFWNGNRL